MPSLSEELNEIITPSAYGFDQYHNSSCPECMFDFKEARTQILALLHQYGVSERKIAYEHGLSEGIESCINSGHIFTEAELTQSDSREGK